MRRDQTPRGRDEERRRRMNEGDERREGRKECIRLDEGKRGSKKIRRGKEKRRVIFDRK